MSSSTASSSSASSSSASSVANSSRSVSPVNSFDDSTFTLPGIVKSPMVWECGELDPKDYVVSLDATERAIIRAAVIAFKLSGRPRGEISQENFALSPELVAKLHAMSVEIHHGTGLRVLRGLDAANFNDEEAVIAFAGVATHIGDHRATDSYANQTLSHVRDATHDPVPVGDEGIGLAGSKTTAAQSFHSDRFSGDILALYIRNEGGPGHGGDQFVASGARIYNELRRNDPDVLETLAKPNWPFERKRNDGSASLKLGPVLFFSGETPIFQLVRAPLEGSSQIPRDPSMPSLAEEQKAALAKLEKYAQRYCAKLDREPEDIQFINNLGVLHSRTQYGLDGKASNRHLLRLFLRNEDQAWPKPPGWEQEFNRPFEPGMRQELPIKDTDPRRKISGRESHG